MGSTVQFSSDAYICVYIQPYPRPFLCEYNANLHVDIRLSLPFGSLVGSANHVPFTPEPIT